MIRKSVVTVLLAATLVAPAGSLLAAPAFAAESAQGAIAVGTPGAPTLLKTGERSVMVLWSAGDEGDTYTVSVAGGSVQRTKNVDGTSTTFSNLPLNHRYMASVTAVDASGQKSEAVMSNTLELGQAPASEGTATPTPVATTSPTQAPTPSATPSSVPSTQAPTPSATTSSTPSATPSTSTPSTTPLATAGPQPSAEPPATPSDQSLISQVQPSQWAIGALVALLTFAALMAGRILRRRQRA